MAPTQVPLEIIRPLLHRKEIQGGLVITLVAFHLLVAAVVVQALQELMHLLQATHLQLEMVVTVLQTYMHMVLPTR
jgi:hypothetical protein